MLKLGDGLEEIYHELTEQRLEVERLKAALNNARRSQIDFCQRLGINPYQDLPDSLTTDLKQAIDPVLYGVYRA